MPVTREGDDHLQVPEGCRRICDYPSFTGAWDLWEVGLRPEIFRVGVNAVTRCSQTVTDT